MIQVYGGLATKKVAAGWIPGVLRLVQNSGGDLIGTTVNGGGMSGGDNQAEAVAGAVATKIVAKIKPKRESDPVYIRVVFAGAVLALIGFFLPWYSVVFAPPGGSVTVHHTTVHAFSFTYNGLTESGTTPGNVLARSPIRCGSRAASAGAPPRSRRLTTC